MFAGIWAIIAHYSLGFGVAGVCLAIWLFSAALATELRSIPFVGGWLADNVTHIREWAILGAILAASHTFVYGIGVRDGEVRVKAQWNAATQAAIERGQNARSAAERSIGGTPANDRGLRNDPDNRKH